MRASLADSRNAVHETRTDEYNLALGQHRADKAREFLVGLGITPHRITTISYGEERPDGRAYNKEAWAKNRRDQFVVTAGLPR